MDSQTDNLNSNTVVMNENSSNTGNNNTTDQPSFDEVVELISTGRADQIPGIKQIPLKINESAPSEPTMQRPLKPWERVNETENGSTNGMNTESITTTTTSS